jgi:hypothetical protein
VFRRAVLVVWLATAACEPAPPPTPASPPIVYPGALGDWPPARATSAFGRGAPPQLVDRVPIVASPALLPLTDAQVVAVPGDGPALAIAHGRVGDEVAVEAIDVDAGTIAWRHVIAGATSSSSIRYVDRAVIVVVDESATTVLGLDGVERWKRDGHFRTAGAGSVVFAVDTSTIAVVDVATGTETRRAPMPAGISALEIEGRCDGDLFAISKQRLIRLAVANGAVTTAWTAAIGSGSLVELDPCGDPIVVATLERRDGSTPYDLRSVDRATGRIVGGPIAIRGWWPSRTGGGIEVAVAGGIERWPRDLAARDAWHGDVAGGPMIASRGDRRLIAAPNGTAIVLDRDGVAAFIPVGRGSALGDRFIVGSRSGASITRITLPFEPPVRLPRPTVGLVPPVDAERREPPTSRAIDAAAFTIHPGDIARAPVAIDPDAIWYALAGRLSRFDLRTRSWNAIDGGCGSEPPDAIAVAGDVIACSGPADDEEEVRAVRDGSVVWRWRGAVDTIDAAGDAIVVGDRDRSTTIDAITGEVRIERRTDTGHVAVTTPIVVAGTTATIELERGALVARPLAAPLVALWASEIRGTLTSLRRAGDDVVAIVDDADAYRIDPATGEATPVAAAFHAIAMADGDPQIVTATRHGASLVVRVLDRAGERWRAELAIDPGATYRLVAPAAAGAPIVVAIGTPAANPPVDALLDVAVVLEAATGVAVDAIALPAETRGTLFSTAVDGRPVAGAVVFDPLRVVTF